LLLLDKIVVKRPSFISLDISSLIKQPATLYVRNVAGEIVREIQKLKVVPTTVKKQIPIFISTKGIYLITSLRFLYRNPEN